jgi:hypothetical protein
VIMSTTRIYMNLQALCISQDVNSTDSLKRITFVNIHMCVKDFSDFNIKF